MIYLLGKGKVQAQNYIENKAYLVVLPRLRKKISKLKAEFIRVHAKEVLKINQKDKDLSP